MKSKRSQANDELREKAENKGQNQKRKPRRKDPEEEEGDTKKYEAIQIKNRLNRFKNKM